MEPITLIVSALVAGATTALKDVAGAVVKDAYAGLKTMILNRYGGEGDVAEAVEQVEAKPESAGRQMVLKEELAETGAPEDAELLRTAEALLVKVKPDVDTSVTAEDHSVAVGGNVGGNVTNIHGDGNVVGDHSESRVEK
jgi:hypothetical protein